MASGPITSWEIDGETVETVADFIFWSSKITADDDCSHDDEDKAAKRSSQESQRSTVPLYTYLTLASSKYAHLA